MLIKLALKSLGARRVTVGLTVISITISVLVLLSIQHIKYEAKASFTRTVSGVDLIVGARTSQLNLLLYSVFRIGNATNNISWQSFQDLSQQQEVAWTIPISLGDSHRGFRVLGTTKSYFQHFHYGNERKLKLANGEPFSDTFEAVLGADVAKKLSYKVGQRIVLAHGIGSTSFTEHKDKPFIIVGILEPTGTPVDQTIHARLDGIEAIHQGWQSGVDLSHFESHSDGQSSNLTPKNITAFMVGLKSKLSTFSFQRKVNQAKKEPLLAILPGVALAELWRMMGMVEGILWVISWLVIVAALIGMSTMMLAAMQERKHEFAVLRAIGARPLFIVSLVQTEVVLITLLSVLLAVALLWVGLVVSESFLLNQFALNISASIFSTHTLMPILLIVVAGILVGFVPSIAAYRTNNR